MMRLCIVLAVSLWSFSMIARSFYMDFGKCALPSSFPKDESKIDSSYFLCLRGAAGTDLLYNPPERSTLSSYFEWKASFHKGSKHSFLYHDEIFAISNLFGREQIPSEFQRVLRTLSYQYGNLSMDSWSLNLGVHEPVFGVQHYPDLPFKPILNPRFLWGEPREGLILKYDTQKSTRVELSWTADASYELGKIWQEHLASLRLLQDIPINANTRAVASFLIKRSGEKRASFGIVTHGFQKNILHAEWVRIYTSNKRPILDTLDKSFHLGKAFGDFPYYQFLRVAYEDSPLKPVQAIALFDYLSYQYRLFTLGFNFRSNTLHTMLRLSLSYKQDLSLEKKNLWLIGTGVGVQL